MENNKENDNKINDNKNDNEFEPLIYLDANNSSENNIPEESKYIIDNYDYELAKNMIKDLF